MENTTITPAELLQHWQGHRRLTRRMIEAFPEEELFRFSVGGMRPFAALTMEMIRLADSGMNGVVKEEWKSLEQMFGTPETIGTREELLQLWDKITAHIDELWPQIPLQRFHETVRAYGQYEGTVFSTIFYWIDNEIHHRGQGYVYLRALGIEPPAFWDRN